jgi:thymidylate synthase
MSWFTVGDEYCSIHEMTIHMNGDCCACSDEREKKKMNEEKKRLEDGLCPRCGLPIHPCIPCEEIIAYNNHTDSEYIQLLELILKEGRRKKNRTGIDTIGIFGAMAKFDVSKNAFPILTTKKIHFKSIVHELLWFLKGDTNIKYLVDNDVHIWDEWAYKRYVDWYNKLRTDTLDFSQNFSGKEPEQYTQNEFIQKIKEDAKFAEQWGELGKGTYGSMWRDFPVDHVEPGSHHVLGVDQIATIIDKLKTNPDDRRMIVSAWHPYWVNHCALPPCHCFMQFNTEELTFSERWNIAIKRKLVPDVSWEGEAYNQEKFDTLNIPKRRINLLMLIRSNDMFLGAPFNLTSYSLLIAMVAHCVGMEPGTLTYTIGDCHLYVNHMEQVKTQLVRTPRQLPKLWLNPEVKDIFSFKYEDIKLIDYNPHPAIRAPIAV